MNVPAHSFAKAKAAAGSIWWMGSLSEFGKTFPDHVPGSGAGISAPTPHTSLRVRQIPGLEPLHPRALKARLEQAFLHVSQMGRAIEDG